MKIDNVAIVGVGHTPLLRKTDQSLPGFACAAALQAIRDAGLTPQDIDGYAGNPVAMHPNANHWDGVDEVSGRYMASVLGLKNLRWVVDMTRGLASDSLLEAIHAVQSGACRHVLVLRAMLHPTGVRYGSTRTAAAAGGPAQFSAPYGMDNGIGRTAVWLQRYMHETGATRQALYHVAKTLRDNACLNPNAYWHTPLSEDEYMNAPMIFEPMSRFDCDIPVTGAGAVIVTSADRARELKRPAAYIKGLATEYEANDLIWRDTGLSAQDIQCAQLYDGFLPFIWYWMERLQLCEPGQAHRFTMDGNVSLSGRLPICTFGGSVAEGRLNGMGHICEGALQAMGRAGPRQIKNLEHCLVTLGFLFARGLVMVLAPE